MAAQDQRQQTEAAGNIREILLAEAEIRRKVESCREEMNARLAAEQERARGIYRRTSERLSRIHTHCEQQVAERAAELRARAEREAPPVQLDEPEQARLDAAVKTLAGRLIGGVDG